MPPMLCLIVALNALECAGPDFIQGVVSSESGFDGAVTVVEESVDDGLGVVTVSIPYKDVRGDNKMGQGRIIVRREDLESGKPLPAFCHVHYEKSVGGAREWCQRGWAVATAHYKEGGGEFPIDPSVGDGYNLAHALVQWVRRLPFIDRTRLHVDGGSQGGYMALAISADFFPVTATTADAPVVNWAYNLGYLEANKACSKYPQADPMAGSPLPVMCGVTILTDWGYAIFGNDLRSATWYWMSPVSAVGRITCPVLVLCATGDMLVPMEQMTRKHLRPFDPARFPEGYTRDFDSLTLCELARKTFEEVLPPEQTAIQLVPLQEHSFEVSLAHFTGKEKKPSARPAEMERPWSRTHQWSLCYLDEGPPTPYAAHASHEWNTTPASFVSHYQQEPPTPALLNAAKLEYLLQRYAGQLANPPTLADGRPANRLNYPALEKLDVVTGLLDYAGLGPEHAARLARLYAEGSAHPWGDALSLEALAQERDALQAGLKPAP